MKDEPPVPYDPRRVDLAVYEELRHAARALLVRQAPGMSLTPTGPVHDA